jgi:hypothetical protein
MAEDFEDFEENFVIERRPKADPKTVNRLMTSFLSAAAESEARHCDLMAALAALTTRTLRHRRESRCAADL